MKLQHYMIGLLLVVLTLPKPLSAQSIENQFLGTWTFDYDSSVNSMSKKSKDHYTKMDTSRKDKLSRAYKNRKVTFHANGEYVQVLSDGRTVRATWSMDNNNKLKIVKSNGRSLLFKIKMPESDKLILNQINTTGGSMKVLFTNWHLTKN